MGTNKSRGIDRIEADRFFGSRCRIMITSLSDPENCWGLPNCLIWLGLVNPARVSLPIRRMFSGVRPSDDCFLICTAWGLVPPVVGVGVRSGATWVGIAATR